MGLMGAGDEFSPHTFVSGAGRGTHLCTYVGKGAICPVPRKCRGFSVAVLAWSAELENWYR